jgi:signal peptidase I
VSSPEETHDPGSFWSAPERDDTPPEPDDTSSSDGVSGDLAADAAGSPSGPDDLEPDVVPLGEAPERTIRDQQDSSFGRWLLEFVVLVGLAFVLALLIRTFVVQPFFIPTSSMAQTLEVGDRVLVNKFVYRFASPSPGDIVVFDAPGDPDTDLIKRVVAIEGQTVEIVNGRVFVDGVAVDEPYLNPNGVDTWSMAEPFLVPDDHVWVMGDNRANSSDSRVFGSLHESAILGEAFAIYWPLSSLSGL